MCRYVDTYVCLCEDDGRGIRSYEFFPGFLLSLSCVSVSLQLLLKRGASLDLRCPAVKSYKSALFVACEVNAPEIVQLLLEAGADPNWKGHNTYTPTLVRHPFFFYKNKSSRN